MTISRLFLLYLAIALGSALAQIPPRFQGSVPRAGGVTSSPMDLSLREAIRLGLDHNLGIRLAASSEQTARGERMLALARLLPQISANVSETSQQVNLAAFGFKPSANIPGVVGPFGVFDARARLSQTIFNLRQLYEKRAADKQMTVTALEASDARETVVEVVTALYWDAVSGASRIQAAQAQLDSADASLRMAEDRKKAGLVPAIDVLRAKVESQTERQRLLAARSAFEKQKLRVAEAIGLPDAQSIRLTDALGFQPASFEADAASIAQAARSRKDYQAQFARVEAAELRRKAITKVRTPTVSLDGDYGTLGSSPASSHGTFSLRVGVNIPIYSSGADRGVILREDAEVARQKDLLAELQSRIGFEVRAAKLDLESSAEQVQVSKSAQELASKQVEMASDRFRAGVTDSLELVQAQQGLAAANENYIASLYAYNLAKVHLARALGGIEKNLADWATTAAAAPERK